MKLITNNLNRKKINSVIKTIEKYCADANETFYMEGFVQSDKEDPTYVCINITLNTNELDIPRKLRTALERNGVYLSYRLSNGNEPLEDVRGAAPMNNRQREIVNDNLAMFRENQANGRVARPLRVVDPHLPPPIAAGLWEPYPDPVL